MKHPGYADGAGEAVVDNHIRENLPALDRPGGQILTEMSRSWHDREKPQCFVHLAHNVP
jgi:hypothetical protein